MTIGTDTLASYSFTGTNGTTPPATGTTVLDSNPVPAQIQANACQFTGNFTGNPNKLRLLSKASMGAAPVRVEVQLSAIVGGFQGAFFHNSGATGSENGYYLYFDGGNFAIDKYSSGSATTILASSYIGTIWSGYETGIMRFEFDVVGGNAVLTARSSRDGYATAKTVTDSTSPLITTMDVEYWSADSLNTTTTIDSVVLTGSAVGGTAGNASGDIATATSSAPAGSATSARGVTVTLRNAAGALLNTINRRFWTRTTLDAVAADGGSTGISVTCDSNGVFALTGLTVSAGAGWLTYKDPTDDLNCHNIPVTFA